MKMWIMLQYLEIERREEIGSPQGTARMAALGAMYHPYDVPPDLCSNCL